MTDAQLAVLIRGYKARLERIVERIEGALPPEVKQATAKRTYLGQKSTHVLATPALDPLRDFIEHLEGDAIRLEAALTPITR